MQAFLFLFLSFAHAEGPSAPPALVYVPLSAEEALGMQGSGDGPEEGAQEGGGRVPLAWSAVGGWSVGDDYALHDGEGEGEGEGVVMMRCQIRSFEVRTAAEGGEGEGIWAALLCAGSGG